MKVGFPGGPRLEWYDRNPQLRRNRYCGSSVAPHSVTERWAYTVPTGKKALIMHLFVSLVRVTAPTTAMGSAAYTLIGDEHHAYLMLYGNTVNDGRTGMIGTSELLAAGETINAKTFDSNTGGTISYAIVCDLNEFDA